MNEAAVTAWADISQELSAAYGSIQRASIEMGRLGNVDHIRENLEPVLESVGRFRDLARDKRLDAEQAT